MREIAFKSRYGDLRKLVENEPGSFTFSGFNTIKFMRVSKLNEGDGFEFIDPDGGPLLSVGLRLTNDLTIKSIIFNDGRYKILTENYDEHRNSESQNRVHNGEESSGNKNVL